MLKVIAILFTGVMIAQQASAYERVEVQYKNKWGQTQRQQMTLDDGRLYQINKFNQTQYHKPSLKVDDGRIVQINRYGQTQHHKPSVKIGK